MTETETWYDHDEDGKVTDTYHGFDTAHGGRVTVSEGMHGEGVYIDLRGSSFLTMDEANELARLIAKVALS